MKKNERQVGIIFGKLSAVTVLVQMHCLERSVSEQGTFRLFCLFALAFADTCIWKKEHTAGMDRH